MKITELQPDL